MISTRRPAAIRRAPRRPRLSSRRAPGRPARPRARASFRARARREETGTTGFPEAKARALTVLSPIRMPVNEPGARRDGEDVDVRDGEALGPRGDGRRRRGGGPNGSSPDSPPTSPTRRRSSRRAAEPLEVVVSTARMRMDAQGPASTAWRRPPGRRRGSSPCPSCRRSGRRPP